MAGFAAIVTAINARAGPLYRILVSASGADPEAATLLDDLTRQRRQGQLALVRSIADALEPALTNRVAADIVQARVSGLGRPVETRPGRQASQGREARDE